MLIAKQINPVDLCGMGGLPLLKGTPKRIQFEQGEIQGGPWSWENGLWHKLSHCAQWWRWTEPLRN